MCFSLLLVPWSVKNTRKFATSGALHIEPSTCRCLMQVSFSHRNTTCLQNECLVLEAWCQSNHAHVTCLIDKIFHSMEQSLHTAHKTAFLSMKVFFPWAVMSLWTTASFKEHKYFNNISNYIWVSGELCERISSEVLTFFLPLWPWEQTKAADTVYKL